VFVPHKYVGGFNVPQGQMAIMRELVTKTMRFRKKAKAEQAKRSER